MPYRLGESPINVVSAQGFEPRTHALEGRCSIQLSYAPTLFSLQLVRMKGVEPPRHRRQILSLVRLPIPPHPHLIVMLVEDGGFEPPKSLTTDLQSAPFGRSGNPPRWS